VIRNLTLSEIPFVCIKNFMDFDLSSGDSWLPFQYVSITRAVVCHQSFLFRHSTSDGGHYVESLATEYLRKVDRFLKHRNVAVTYAVVPPHFAVYEELCVRSRVVLFSHVIDSHQTGDTENLVMRSARECIRTNFSRIEYFDTETISNLDLDQGASFLLADRAPGLYRIEGNDSITLTELDIHRCKLTLTKSPHTFSAISPKKVRRVVIGNARSARELITETFTHVTHFDSIYLSIVVTGRNDQYGGNFLNRAQTFLNQVSASVERVPLADVEVVYVDYATPFSDKKLYELLNIPPALHRRVRFIVVPSFFHSTLRAKVSFLEYTAKNIGIRRSKGEFVLAANPDSLLSDSFFELCSQRAFNPGVFYTSDRIVMQKHQDHQTEFLKINEPWKFERKFSKFWLLTPDKEKFGYSYQAGLGDFTMLSKELWEALGAYDSVMSNRYLDHMFKAKMLKLVCGGYAASLPNPVLHQYHVHLSSSIPGYTLALVNATLDDYLVYGRLKQRNGEPDKPFWGAPKKQFREVLL
jgi:hypothetical protein